MIVLSRRGFRAIKAAEATQLRRFAADGYIIPPRAASHAAIDRLQRVIAAAFQHGNRDLLYQAHIDKTTRPAGRPGGPPRQPRRG